MDIHISNKVLLSILLVLMLFGAAPRAHAFSVTIIGDVVDMIAHFGNWITDLLTTVETTISAVIDTYMQMKDTVLDPAAWVLARVQIFAESNKIVALIQSGRQEIGGGPLFVTNWQTIGNVARIKERNFFLDQLAADSKINPAFKDTILTSLSSDPSQGSVFDQYRSTFEQDVTNPETGESFTYDQFTKNFASGGWQGWNAILQKPGNNPYMTYLGLQAEKARREQSAVEARINEALSGGGALGLQDCQQRQSAEEFVGPPDPNAPTIEICDIVRPAQTVISDFNQVLAQPIEILGQVSEISQTLTSALTSIVGQIRSLGIDINIAGSGGTNVRQNRRTITQTTKDATLNILNQFVAQGNKGLSDLDKIWGLKVKTLNKIGDVPGGLISGLKLVIDDAQYGLSHGAGSSQYIDPLHRWPTNLSGRCALHPEIVDVVKASLEQAQDKKIQLEREVGVPPIIGAPFGDLELGGPLAEELSANVQALREQIRILESSSTTQDEEETVRSKAATLANVIQESLLKIGQVEAAQAEYQTIVNQTSGAAGQLRGCYAP